MGTEELKSDTEYIYYLIVANSPNKVEFEINYSKENGDIEFPNICINFLEDLLHGFMSVTCVELTDDLCINYMPGNKWFGRSARGMKEYPKFIDEYDCQIKCNYAITRTNGINTGLLSEYLDNYDKGFRARNFCVYADRSAMPACAEANNLLFKGYTFEAIYSEMQDNLSVFIDSGSADIGVVINTIKSVCVEHGRKLNIVYLNSRDTGEE